MAGGQCAGEKRTDGEECGGGEQFCCSVVAVHPVREQFAEECVEGESDDYADCCADECDACGDPEDMGASRAESEANTELGGALRDAVGDDTEDADEGERERHCGEGAEEDREETLASVLGVALEASSEICWTEATDAIAARMECR